MTPCILLPPAPSQGVTWKPSVTSCHAWAACRAAALPPPFWRYFLSFTADSRLFCSMRYGIGIWERSPNNFYSGWFLFQWLIHVWEQSRCNTFLVFNLVLSQIEILRGGGKDTTLCIFQIQNKLTTKPPGAITSCLFARAGNNPGSIWCQSPARHLWA